MIQGLYAAANGMMAIEQRQAVTANNIANATTPGFKRQLAVQQGYYQAFFGKTRNPLQLNLERAPGGGVKTIETFSNYSNGTLQATGNPLDVALVGPGYLQVATPDGVQFTRSGHLAVGDAGLLISQHGFNVLDIEGQPIDMTGGPAEIDSVGNIMIDGELRAQLGLLEFADQHGLQRRGYSLFSASPSMLATSAPAGNTTLSAQSIELSNVEVPTEMANMMLALRAYAANQRVITAIDETASRLINQFGAPS